MASTVCPFSTSIEIALKKRFNGAQAFKREILIPAGTCIAQFEIFKVMSDVNFIEGDL